MNVVNIIVDLGSFLILSQLLKIILGGHMKDSIEDGVNVGGQTRNTYTHIHSFVNLFLSFFR